MCSCWKHFLSVVAYDLISIFSTNIQTIVFLFFSPGRELLCVNSTICTTLSNIHQYNDTLRIQFHLVLSELFSTAFLNPNEDNGSSSFLSCLATHRLLALLSEVSELNASPSAHTAKGGRLDVPVFNRIGKQTDACVQVLLVTGPGGTEVVDSHAADFVAMEVNHLEVAQGAEARWDLFQTVVVQVDLTDARDAGKAAIFYKLDLVKTES